MVLPIAYLPPLDYMAIIESASEVELELFETFPRQTLRNRCHIFATHGEQKLVIPVKRPHGNRTPTAEVEISSHQQWQSNHWRSITSAYGKAPFFVFYKDLLAPFYLNKQSGPLWRFNIELLKQLVDELNISTSIKSTVGFHHQQPGKADYRDAMSSKKEKTELIKQWIPYYQVFEDKHGFIPNLSIIDLLFHLGPDAREYLKQAGEQMMNIWLANQKAF